MRTSPKVALAAIVLIGGSAVATAADAQSRYHRGNHTGTAIAAGVAGLALGAALSSGARTSYGYSYGYGGYPVYSYGYYAPPPRYYAPPPRYRAPPRSHYRARVCTYWQYDRWGRPYQVQARC